MTTNPAPLTGLAIGDALGMPFETACRDRPDLLAWDGRSYGSSVHHKLGPGQWTDDTQMSCALACSLVRKGGYDADHVAAAYLGWFDGEPRGYSKTTKLAMENLRAHVSWAESGVDRAEGNGTAMRVTPIGVRYTKLTDIRKFAAIDAVITHDAAEPITASIAMATLISGLLAGLGKIEALQAACNQPYAHPLSLVLNALTKKIHSGDVYYDQNKGPSSHVVEAFPAAVEAFLVTDSFETAVVTAIKLGGDTDTVASMAGALAGAFYGYDAIPERWRAGLEDTAQIRALEIKLLNIRGT